MKLCGADRSSSWEGFGSGIINQKIGNHGGSLRPLGTKGQLGGPAPPPMEDVKQSGHAAPGPTRRLPNRHRFPQNSASLLNMRAVPTETLFSPRAGCRMGHFYRESRAFSMAAGSHDTRGRHRTRLFSETRGNAAASHLGIPEFLSTASPPCAGW